MNNKVIIPIIVGIVVLSLGISLHRISSKSADLQYEFLSKTMAEPSGMESAGDKASGNYGKAEAFDAESSDAILFIERKITSLEPCRISAGSIILDIPLGAVSSEKDVTVRGLRDNELPALDYGLVNVTSTYGGYRCLPHGKFNKPLQLSIGYDTLLIPAGYSPHDIRTFFYDEDRMEWVCMPVDSIDQEHQLVVTSTDHFTDFINGILTQPEIPDASGYANTSIRGIEYANPLEGMNIMQAPTANNNGSCSMNYPIVLPAGRNGMAPQISISYSSDVKDGIMGPGWSLNIPSITVDTRWGVPRYDYDEERQRGLETESYLVNGEAIVVAEESTDPDDPSSTIITRHKPLYVEGGVSYDLERNAEGTRQYAYLKEGSFDKIIRHGNTPKNYWWEVTDRNGVKYIYGDMNNNGLVLHSSLAGIYPDNNIAVWGLSEMKDPHGNAIKYFYDIETEEGAHRHPLAKQMRVSKIDYTSYIGNNQQIEGKYHVFFDYEERPIVAPLSTNYGFFTSDMRLLSKITIKYNNEFVKCYKFKYGVGARSKKVLKAIAEITDERLLSESIDCNNNTQKQGFYVHCFDYYSEDAITFEQGAPLQVSAGETINILGMTSAADDDVPGVINISKNTGFSITGGGSACVGFNDNRYYNKSNTFGANYHHSCDRNNQKAQLLDLNGDGVVDRIEKIGRDVIFYKGNCTNGRNVSFEENAVTLDNSIPRLCKSETRTNSVGTEALLNFTEALQGNLGFCYSRTKTINSDFFVDVNGDGFTDFVSDGNVYLNFPDEDGIPQFTDMSSVNGPVDIPYDECYNFEYDGNVDVHFSEEAGWESSRAKRDPVVYWRCPETGIYNFNFEVIDPVYQNSNNIIGFAEYNPDHSYLQHKYSACPGSLGGNIDIPQGAYVLFHLHSQNEQSMDIFTHYNITITQEDYDVHNEDLSYRLRDANGKELMNFVYNNDVVIQDGNPFVAPRAGDVNWSTIIGAEASLSDNLNFYLIHKIYDPGTNNYVSRDLIYNIRELNSGQAIGQVYDNRTLHVEQNDQLLFKIKSNSNVDWSKISFKSNVSYADAHEAYADAHETYHPSLDMSIYSKRVFAQKCSILEDAGEYSVSHNQSLVNLLRSRIVNRGTKIYFTVKCYDQDGWDNANQTYRDSPDCLLIAKQELPLTGPVPDLPFTLPTGGRVFFDYTVNGELFDIDVSSDLCNLTVVSGDNNINNQCWVTGIYAEQLPETRILGKLYRGWGQFSYKVDESVIGNQSHLDYFSDRNTTIPSLLELDYNYALGVQNANYADYAAISQDQNLNLQFFSDMNYDPEASDESVEQVAGLLQETINNTPMTNPTVHAFEPMIADIVNERWTDCYGSAFVCRNSIGSGIGMFSIINEMDNNELAEPGDHPIDFSNPLGTGGHFPITNKVGVSNNYSTSTGATIGGSIGFNYTRSDSRGKSDMMDMNGDGYPDAVTSRDIQYTLPNGDMSSKKLNFDDEVYTSYNVGNAFGGSLSFKPVTLKEKGTNPKSTEKNLSTTAGAESVIAAGLGVSVNRSNNKVLRTYIDVNSDGLPDIVNISDDDSKYVEYNLGYKFSERYPIDINMIGKNKSATGSAGLSSLFNGSFNLGNYSLSGGFGSSLNMSEDQTTMLDINSDGLIDIVSVSRGRIIAYLNNGREFVYNGRIDLGINKLSSSETDNISGNVSGTAGFPIYFVKVTASLYADVLYSVSNEKLRLMDINGDGAVDILEVGSNGITVKYGIPQKRNILKKVTTPALGEYEMAYSMLYPDMDNPNHKWIMTALKVSDNDGNFADGSDDLHYQFEYSGMKYHRIERETYGFAEVTAKVVDNWSSPTANVLRKQKEYYHTENGLRHGLKYRDEVLDDHDNLQTSTDYNWTLNDLNTGIVVEESECGSEQEVYPRLKSELTTVYSSNSGNTLVSAKHYEYGKYGNITKYTNNYNPNELVKAEMDYYSPDEFGEHRFLDKIKVMTVKSASDAVIRKMSREYDNYGDITKVDNYIDERTYASTDFEYDMYGNLVKATYPENGGGHRAYTTYEYDDIHTYLSSVTEASGVTTQLTQYDYRFGKPTVVIAPNGTRTVYTYYSDGKIKTIKAPTDENQEYSLKFEYWDELRNQSPRWARVIHKDRFIDGNTFVTHTICDGLGRTMLNARKAVVDGEVKFVVSGKNVYDDYGRVISSYQPAEVSREDDCLSARFENPTKYKYDCLDRVTTTTTPDDKTIEKSYNVSIDVMGNQAMLVTTTYPLSREQITYTDSRGLQTATVQASESGNITTTFEYSPMGELISSKDPEGAVTKYKYDMLGHLVWRCHPDAGETTFFYDNAGNLLSKATQELLNSELAIKYEYDEYNRLKKILYPDNQDMNVYYEYGGSNDGLNAGLVTKRQDGVSLQTYSYNEMGDLIENVRNFATPDRQLMTFKTMWTYDTWGRIKDITYPDRETVKYKYDNAGKVVSMVSGNANMRDEIIVEDIRYDKYGNRTYVKYGNGTHNHYEYDPLSLQLTHMSSFATDVVLQDVHYEYDDVYNIIGINNDGEFHYRYDYMYDRFNRLVKSDGQSALDADYHFEMTYSPAGKIMDYILTGRNNINGEIFDIDRSDSYIYANQQQPHTVTHIGPDKYLWDANGNIKRRIGNGARRPEVREHYFNEENRLAAISDGLVDEEGRPIYEPGVRETVAAYLYDADGERVWKFSGIVTDAYRNERRVSRDLELDKTFYPTQHITLDNRNLYKHYFIGDERISTEVCRYDERQFTQQAHRIILLDGNEREFSEKVIKQVKRALAHVGYEDPFEFNRGDYSHPEQEKFFYHYTHQGSVAALTNRHGEFYQHLQYLPYGEVFVDKHDGSSFTSPYTFSAKEKDAESGYNYFGARYYTDNIMMWLSVDPMSDERPWISPYNYCQWNPIGRVDTWGMLDDVYINGKAAEEATEQLNTKNIKFSRAEDGKLSIEEGVAKTRKEKLLVQAIESKDVSVNVTAEYTDVIEKKDGISIKTKYGGSFMGNSLTFSDEGNAIHAETKQFVNPAMLKKYYGEKRYNKAIYHEITESFMGGIISIRMGKEAKPAYEGSANYIYNEAHRKASRQPYCFYY